MRIITGSAKGVRLDTVEGEATRPTGERAKEAIFSVLQFDLEGRRVLDLFAGSGQLGLEALSRGADSAMFVDASGDAMVKIKANATKTKLFDRGRYLVSDYRNYIRKAAGKDRFSLFFLDPPYADKCINEALKRIFAASLVENGAIFVCESAEPFTPEGEFAASLSVLKQAKYGIAYVSILHYEADE